MNCYKIISLNLFFMIFINFVKTDESCNENNCNITSYRRCYKTYLSIGPSLECKCLKGLYQYGNQCVGVIRYDMNFLIYSPSFFVDKKKSTDQFKQMIKNIPIKSKNSLVDSNFEMDSESSVFIQEDQNTVKVYNKVIIWKKNQKNPTDLPAIQLENMKLFFKEYFRLNFKYDMTSNYSFIDTFGIGFDDVINQFILTWNLAYNEWTCSTEKYNYCQDHAFCTPNQGNVKCKCDDETSIDISPQKTIFPGEVCQYSCPKTCFNGGLCRFKSGYFTCYCPDRYIGEKCEIDIILFAIIVLCLIIAFIFLSIACGFVEYSSKKNHEIQIDRLFDERNNHEKSN